MEYTRSKGEHSYETFDGTPEEIAKLINAIDKETMKSFFNGPSIMNPIANLNPTGLMEVPTFLNAGFEIHEPVKQTGFKISKCSCGHSACRLHEVARFERG